MKRLLFSIITLLAVILLCSCGGIETENINYTKYNGYSPTAKTTEISLKPSTITNNSEAIDSKTTAENSINKPSTITNNSEVIDSKTTAENQINKTATVTASETAIAEKGLNNTQKQNKNTVVNNKATVDNTSKLISTTKEAKASEIPESTKITQSATRKHTETTVQLPESTTTVQTTTLPPLLDTDFCYITENGTKFHRDNCRYLYKSSIKIIVKQAKDKDYSPCLVCKPQ